MTRKHRRAEKNEKRASATGSKGKRRAPNEALRTLSVRNFRNYVLGQLVSNVGTWMQRAAQDLLVLHLTGNSGRAVGVLTALQFLPQTLFGLFGGVFADRFNKRRLLLVTQTCMAVQSLVLGVLTVSGLVTVRQVYALAFILGVATALDSPARNAFVTEMVGKSRVSNAVSLSSAQFNAARILGPALAGLSIAVVGIGPVFLVNTVSYAAVLLGLLTMRLGELHPPRAAKAQGIRLADAFRHVLDHNELLLPVAVIAFVGMFALNFQVTISLVAVTVFHTGAAAFGVLSSAYAVGSLLGAVRGAGRRKPPTARRLVRAAIVFGLLEAAVGLMPSYHAFMALLVPTGMAGVTVTTTANSMVQLNADSRVRGRVMSIYYLVLLGGTPIGAPLVGVVSDALGARYSLIIGGLVAAGSAAVLSGLVAARRSQRARHRRPSLPAHDPEPGPAPAPGPAPVAEHAAADRPAPADVTLLGKATA